jgi:hypothetical protein
MFHPKPLPDVLKSSAHRESGRGQHRAFQFRPQAFPQDRPHIDRRSLQKHILSSTFVTQTLRTFFCFRGIRSPPSAAPLDPKYRVPILSLQSKSQLHLNLLRPPDKVENFLRLLRQPL